jgi:hypothetical protein
MPTSLTGKIEHAPLRDNLFAMPQSTCGMMMGHLDEVGRMQKRVDGSALAQRGFLRETMPAPIPPTTRTIVTTAIAIIQVAEQQ